MSFFSKLNISFIEIPLNSNLDILKRLIDHELFHGEKQKNYIYNNLIYDENLKRSEDFKYTEWWRQAGKYITSIESETFSIVANPYERFVLSFYDFTKNKEQYKEYRPSFEDDINILRNKFELFSKEYHANKHIAGGVGLNIIESIVKNKIDPKYYTINSDSIIDRFKYLEQTTYLNKIFQKFDKKRNSTHYYIYNEQIHKNIHILKKENGGEQLHKIFPKIFEKNFKIKDDESLFIDLNQKQCFKYPFKLYYKSRSKKVCQEFFEQDFYQFHYEINLNI